jgi:hypothetical protein
VRPSSCRRLRRWGTGNPRISLFRFWPRGAGRIGHNNQCLTSKFPTQQNRELIGPYQGIKSTYQGSFLPDQGRMPGLGFPAKSGGQVLSTPQHRRSVTANGNRPRTTAACPARDAPCCKSDHLLAEDTTPEAGPSSPDRNRRDDAVASLNRARTSGVAWSVNARRSNRSAISALSRASRWMAAPTSAWPSRSTSWAVRRSARHRRHVSAPWSTARQRGQRSIVYVSR